MKPGFFKPHETVVFLRLGPMVIFQRLAAVKFRQWAHLNPSIAPKANTGGIIGSSPIWAGMCPTLNRNARPDASDLAMAFAWTRPDRPGVVSKTFGPGTPDTVRLCAFLPNTQVGSPFLAVGATETSTSTCENPEEGCRKEQQEASDLRQISGRPI